MNEEEFNKLRIKMVDDQLVSRGIKEGRVLDAFRKVARHKFVPIDSLDSAYGDYPIPIGSGQTISQPYIVALMTELLNTKSGDKVLEIGTGSGYQTAILSSLGCVVYTVERIDSLGQTAKKRLEEAGFKSVTVRIGDGTLGLPEFAPYDGIIVTAGSSDAPAPLLEQLNLKGRLIVPLGGSFSQVLTVFTKDYGRITKEQICGCVFVPLIGKYGWQRRDNG